MGRGKESVATWNSNFKLYFIVVNILFLLFIKENIKNLLNAFNAHWNLNLFTYTSNLK